MRHRIALPVLAGALALAGCTAGAGPNVAQGGTLTIYAGLPLNGPGGARGQAIENGVKLALADAGGKVGDHRVQAVFVDDTGGHTRWTQAGAAEAARHAAQDITAIGYVGDVESGATRVSLPITNQAEMVQVSPASSAVDLTRAAGGEAPERLQPSGERTFARVVPGDDVQARAAALWAKKLGARRVSAVDDGSLFGKTVSLAFEDGAKGLGLTLDRKQPDAVYVGGEGQPLLKELRRAAADAPRAKLLAPDSLLEPGMPPQTGGLSAYVTSALLDPSQLPPAGQRFVTAYRKRFGMAPDPAAAYGYEAAALLVDAVRRAGSAGDDRLQVIDVLLGTHDRDSILGRYSLDAYGETTLREVSGYRVSGDRTTLAEKLEAPLP